MSAGNLAVDSNVTGLYFAEEALGTPKALPDQPVWYPVEPNSYGEFGAQTKTVKRDTINAARQKRKGAVVGLDVAAGFSLDFTSKVPYVMMQGFMFADWRAKNVFFPQSATSTGYMVASGGAAFTVGDLLFAEGFKSGRNIGLKLVTARNATLIKTEESLGEAETPPAGAIITRVGRQGAAGDYSVTVVDGKPQLNTASGDFSTLGLIPGEWVFLGGDPTATQFNRAEANGLYRVASVASLTIAFDRWPGDASGAAVGDAGANKTIQLFIGHAIKNEASPILQKFRTYQFERFLGGNRYQYEQGCGANTLKVNVKTNDKVTLDMSYVAMDEDLTQVAAKAGARQGLPAEVVFNSGTSFSRMRMIGQDGQTQLTSILTDLTLTIDNGVEPLDGITNNVGAVDLKTSDFTVSGSVEAYLSSLATVAAVKANPDVSIDFGMVENVGVSATGWLFDVPLLMLGDGRLKVEKDKPIKLPLNLDAAGHATLNHTLLAMRFAYLPQLAL